MRNRGRFCPFRKMILENDLQNFKNVKFPFNYPFGRGFCRYFWFQNLQNNK